MSINKIFVIAPCLLLILLSKLFAATDLCCNVYHFIDVCRNRDQDVDVTFLEDENDCWFYKVKSKALGLDGDYIVNPKKDLLSSMFMPSNFDLENKTTFFQQLNGLLKEEQDFSVYADAFNGILYCPEEWDTELKDWLEVNIKDLPPPFYLLLSSLYINTDNLKSAQYADYYAILENFHSQLCSDHTVQLALPTSRGLAQMMKVFQFLHISDPKNKKENKSVNEEISPELQEKIQAEFFKGYFTHLMHLSRAENLKKFEKETVDINKAYWIGYVGRDYAEHLLKREGPYDIKKNFVDSKTAQKIKSEFLNKLKIELASRPSEQKWTTVVRYKDGDFISKKNN